MVERVIDVGAGPALVLIPGIQGRWEWMKPAVDALSTRCRVICGSLPGELGAPGLDRGQGFDIHLDWIDGLLDRAGLRQAAVVGISYGGLVALHYAAHRPERTRTLVLASTPSPSWAPDCRVERYLRWPRLMSPVFALSSPLRLYPEIRCAFPGLLSRVGFSVRHLFRVVRHPQSPTLMARRVRLLDGVDFSRDCSQVTAPTLVVTGTPGLDRVVDVASTRQYLRAITGAHAAEVTDTGHIGLVTKPRRFADLVGGFVSTHDSESSLADRIPA